MPRQIAGLFGTVSGAKAALQELREAGFAAEDISFVGKDTSEHGRTFDLDGNGLDRDEGAGFGMAGGATLGGLAGLLVGVGAIAIPGVGPALVAGSLASALGATLVGAALGAASGGLIGALVAAGIPEKESQALAAGLEHGAALLLIRAGNTEHELLAAQILQRHGARIEHGAPEGDATG